MFLLDGLGASLDRAVLRSQHRSVGADVQIVQMSAQERLERLAALREMYGDPALLRFPGGFVDRPPAIDPELRPVRKGVVDARWPSAYSPWNAEVAELYLSTVENRTAHARLFLADEPGPTLIIVHGYGSGHFGFEERVWPVSRLRKQGWNVVLALLPFHGLRARPGRRLNPPFPAADPRMTNEGFRQAIHDLLGLFAWLRSRGHGPIGVWGMSLGGYTSALLATIERDLAFAGLVIPLASIADYARTHGRLGEGADAEALHTALEEVYAVVSPFSRPSALPDGAVRILAARSDRITGVAQAERLGRHFGVEPTLCPGSHILQVGVRGHYSSWVDWIGELAPRS